jgi:hypothetical protein
MAPGPAGSRLRRGGSSGSAEDSTRRAKLSCLLLWGPVTYCRRARLPDHGVRERLAAGAGCHATPPAHGIDLLRIQRESMPEKPARPHCVCEQRRCAWGVATAVQSNFSQLKLSVIQAKAFRLQRAMQLLAGRRQRFPTVRMVVELGNSEEVAKSANNRACTSTGCCKRLWTLTISKVVLLKSGASRQEKASACNRNGAPSNEHFCDGVVLHGCADVNPAGTKHLDSLLDDDGLAAGCDAVTDEVGDSASGGRASGRIFSAGELHARVPIRT